MAYKALTVTGKAVAAVAILIGFIGKFAPHLFFKIPNGFIPWVMTGNPLPPFITTEPWLPENRGWLKPDDVVVSVAAKSGTTWMLFCSHQIRVKGDDETYPYVDVSLATPWPDLVQTPGNKATMSWESRRKALNTTVLSDGTPLSQYWDNPDYPFRIFKSHHQPEVFGDLIGGKETKFLAMARNGLDQVASAAPFFNNHHDDFRNLWGGFPPATSGEARQDALTRMSEMLPGGIFEEWYFKYVNEWWKVKDESNVLLLHYSDAKKDLSGTVKKMAKFYGVKLNKKEHEQVLEKCSFPYMKAHKHLFHYRLPLNPSYEGKTIMQDGSMTRKGIIGDGKNVFTKEEQETWAKAEEEQFGSDTEKLKWARNGSL